MHGEAVRFNRLVLIVVVLALISTYLTVYTFEAHTIAARHIYEDSESRISYWRSGPSGSLFPWPTRPGQLEVLTRINEVDLSIYTYLIKTWALIGLSILMWALAGLSITKMAKTGR